MLAYILAIALGLASLSLYLSAFFVPEIHRKDDFLWSGVGLFYALILWICAGRITGSVLLGQGAAVALVLSFGWQMVRLRRAIAHPDEQTNLEGVSIMGWLQNRFSGKKIATPPAKVTPKSSPETQPDVNVTQTKESLETATSTEDTLEKSTIEQTKEEKDSLTPETPINDLTEELSEEATDPSSVTTTESLEDNNELDFEPFMADNDAETVIETYEPQDLSSVTSEKEELVKEIEEKTAENSPEITDFKPENPEESNKDNPTKE